MKNLKNGEIMLPIETKNPMFGLYLYPGAKEIMEMQQDVAWTAQEIPVEKDIHCFRHILSEDQLRLVTITLQLFVEIEQKVGEVWEKFGAWFPHSEIEGCCSEISRMEKSVHAFFYQKMSDALNIDPEEIAKNQREINVLKNKLEFLTQITSNLDEDKLLSLATVAMIEQVLLFSNFAMLKSFKSNGNNLLSSTITGVDFVIQDETIHGNFAAYLFKTYLAEAGKRVDKDKLFESILRVSTEIINHEDAVIDFTFGSTKSINDITPAQLKTFIRTRLNSVFEILGLPTVHIVENDVIAEWFYKGSSSIKIHDFFSGGTNQYRRNWKFDNFSRIPHIKGNK